jgi:hypothetical protein
LLVGASEKQSTLDAMAHLLARYLEILPLFFYWALPMKVELKIKPYFGVLPLVFKALKRAFSAPRIWIVEAGYFERLVRPPACEISFEPTISPIRADKFGATAFILSLRY